MNSCEYESIYTQWWHPYFLERFCANYVLLSFSTCIMFVIVQTPHRVTFFSVPLWKLWRLLGVDIYIYIIYTGIIVIIILLILVFLLLFIINFIIIKYVLFVKLCEDKNTSVSITELTNYSLLSCFKRDYWERNKGSLEIRKWIYSRVKWEYFKCFEIKDGIKSV